MGAIVRTKKYLNIPILLLAVVALGVSFWYSHAWLKLCYGLTLFLFGMQCIEEGLHSAAGGTLERLMAKSTATPFKSFLFGMGSTFILQSSTLVSLLTIAFLSTGMIGLASGISIILGTNLGATTGIWLLALAGQSVSLSTFAIPMLIFGILAGFLGGTLKALGRVLVGVSLIFLGIDEIKAGFDGFGGQIDFAQLVFHGAVEVVIFLGVGFLLTCILQSSHATLILTLVALAASQITLTQGFAIAVGSNLGSSATTAIMGMISSERAGQRLALLHLLFNGVTALLCLLLWLPLTTLVTYVSAQAGFGSLIALALFHSLFNILGVAVFWRFQDKLAAMLFKLLPDKAVTKVLPDGSMAVMPRYLDANALFSSDIAIKAASKEVKHLISVGVEVIYHAIFVSADDWTRQQLSKPKPPFDANIQALYEWQVKPLYGEILDFTSKMDIDEEDSRSDELTRIHIAAFTMLGMVKDSKHLQKNMTHFLATTGVMYDEYVQLRHHLYQALQFLCHSHHLVYDSDAWQANLLDIMEHIDGLEVMRQSVLHRLRDGQLDNAQASSLMNDINYVRRIELGVMELMSDVPELLSCQQSS